MEALTTNGTDEGVLRGWLDREFRHWRRAFEASVQREIDDVRREHLGDRPGIAPSADAVERFSRALLDLLTFSRSAGALTDNAVQRLHETAEPKAGAGAVALDGAFAQAREGPTGDQRLHESWARCLMLLYYHHAAGGPPYPGPDSLDRERLAWAREALGGLDDADSLRIALAEYLADPGVRPVIAAVVEHGTPEVLRYQRNLPANRIGLITGAGARWLAGAVERT